MGLGRFLSVLTHISRHHKQHQPVKPFWSHLPVSLQSTRLRGLCTSSLVCLCHGSVYCASMCASMPEVCQHAQRVIPEVSELPWMFPEIPRGPRCPEGQDIVPLCQMAQNPQDCTYGIIFTWNDDICIVLPLMWWPIGCVYCHFIVKSVRLSI